MADIFERLLKNYGPIGQHRERAHGYFTFPKLEGEIGSRMKFRGKEMIVWSLNNYLGLANHPEVRKADADGAKEYGLALPMGARMMSGNSNYHEQLEKELAEFEGECGMAGDQGKLKEIAELKDKYELRLLVDDAHGFGTLGKTGAGAGEEQGVQGKIDLYFSTLAKSMASIGAFVAGDKDIIDYIRYNIRSQIFAKSLPMPLVVGNLKRLELLRTQPQLKDKLWENALKLQNGLKERGFDIGKTDSVVTPVYMKGDVPEATAMVTDLRENYGIFCSIVVYPVIPKGHIIYRLIPTAVHNDDDIQQTLKAFSETKQKLDA